MTKPEVASQINDRPDHPQSGQAALIIEAGEAVPLCVFDRHQNPFSLVRFKCLDLTTIDFDQRFISCV